MSRVADEESNWMQKDPGGALAQVKMGETVTFASSAEQPPGTGAIVLAEWDFEGKGASDHVFELDGTSARESFEASHA
jgi:hypothetical protein